MSKVNPDKTEFVFAPIGNYGSWICTNGRFDGTLAEFLARHDLVFDDDTEFARIKRYSGKYVDAYWYRSYGNKVTITIYHTLIY